MTSTCPAGTSTSACRRGRTASGRSGERGSMPVGRHLAGHDGDEVRPAAMRRLDALRPVDVDRRSRPAACCRTSAARSRRPPGWATTSRRRSTSSDCASWPPRGRCPGRGYQPSPSQSRCGRDSAVKVPLPPSATLPSVELEPLAALVAVQPEERPGEPPRLHGQLAELPLQVLQRRLTASRLDLAAQHRRQAQQPGLLDVSSASPFILRVHQLSSEITHPFNRPAWSSSPAGCPASRSSSARWPTPTAQWCAGPCRFHSSTNRRAPREKR